MTSTDVPYAYVVDADWNLVNPPTESFLLDAIHPSWSSTWSPPGSPRASTGTVTPERVVYALNSADQRVVSKYSSLYAKLRVDLVARERKRVAEKVCRARVARKNARERKFKSARIALLYAERLLRRISFGLFYFIYAPAPTFTDGGVEAPTAIHRRVRTMPAMLIIMIIVFFAVDVPRPNLAVYRRLYTSSDCLGGGSSGGFDGGDGSGGAPMLNICIQEIYLNIDIRHAA